MRADDIAPVRGLLGLLFVLCLFPQTAHSQYERMHVAGAAGLAVGEDLNLSGPEAELEAGWMGVGALGYAFEPGFCIEGTFVYRTSAVERMNTGASLSGQSETLKGAVDRFLGRAA